MTPEDILQYWAEASLFTSLDGTVRSDSLEIFVWYEVPFPNCKVLKASVIVKIMIRMELQLILVGFYYYLKSF